MIGISKIQSSGIVSSYQQIDDIIRSEEDSNISQEELATNRHYLTIRNDTHRDEGPEGRAFILSGKETYIKANRLLKG